MIEPGVGYLRIKSFDEPTGKLVKTTIEKLGGEALKGLVIDLRANPGGAVQAAVDVASLFLQPAQVVFTVRGRTEQKQEALVPALAKPYAFPVAVLMDEMSASARRFWPVRYRTMIGPPSLANLAMERASYRMYSRFPATPV